MGCENERGYEAGKNEVVAPYFRTLSHQTFTAKDAKDAKEKQGQNLGPSVRPLLARPAGELDEMRRLNRGIIHERGSLTRNMARFRDRLDAVVAQSKGVGA